MNRVECTHAPRFTSILLDPSFSLLCCLQHFFLLSCVFLFIPISIEIAKNGCGLVAFPNNKRIDRTEKKWQQHQQQKTATAMATNKLTTSQLIFKRFSHLENKQKLCTFVLWVKHCRNKWRWFHIPLFLILIPSLSLPLSVSIFLLI